MGRAREGGREGERVVWEGRQAAKEAHKGQRERTDKKTKRRWKRIEEVGKRRGKRRRCLLAVRLKLVDATTFRAVHPHPHPHVYITEEVRSITRRFLTLQPFPSDSR